MKYLSCSILSADFANLERDIKTAAKGGCDFLHVDVMDGLFVRNLTIGPPVVKALKKASPLPLDVHLMIEHPSRFLDDFQEVGADVLTVHLETKDPLGVSGLLAEIRRRGMRPGLSIKPSTPLKEAEAFFPLIDVLLIMSVEPGEGGQAFLPGSLSRIEEARARREELGHSFFIEVDGGVNRENIKAIAQAGADILVAGAAIFKADGGSLKSARRLKTALLHL